MSALRSDSRATMRPRRGEGGPSRPIATSLALPNAHVETIDRSHERCTAMGLSRIERPDLAPLSSPDLMLVKERNLRLHSHAAPVMEMLFEQIVNTQSMVVLCDATGTILHSIGDDDFLARASKVALQPGVNWSEHSKGTNAIGTALVSEVPTLVHADEHFMHANHFLTCSAAPILDPRGNILGVLDVTGDQRSYHQHTMALVRMSARMIENHWLSEDYRHVMRLHFHARVECLGTLMEGILAVGPDGKIVGANRGALDQLGLSGVALRRHTLESLFGTTVSELVQQFRSPLAGPREVHSAHGQALHLLARFNWPVWHSISEAAMPGSAAGMAAPGKMDAKRASAAAAAPLGLAALGHGDAQLAALTAKLRRVLDHDIPILIVGDTGTGKELLARAIHHASRRAARPLVLVNCTSIPAASIEAELFGRDDEGGQRKTLGKIEQADGGTLFLDEVADMPLTLQAQLLRVLQERQVTPLGATQSRPVDVAIVCATRHKLRELIDAGSFREDLYYRLNGLAVRLPLLRERSDLLALAESIVAREMSPRTLRLSQGVQRLLLAHPWPGNVRELYNVLRVACVMAMGGTSIEAEHLPDDFVAEAQDKAEPDAHAGGMSSTAALHAGAAAAAAMCASDKAHGDAGGNHALVDIELRAIQAALDAAGGNISVAARRLDISRNTIYRKLRWK